MPFRPRKEEAVHFGCPHCAGDLEYSIEKEKMQCKSCGTCFPVQTITDPSAVSADKRMEVTEYRCPQCGADFHTAQGEPVTHCSFCGSNVVFTQQISRLRRPDLIMPFKITRKECEEIYRKRIRSALFAPKALMDQETVGNFQPVYIPFWRYSASYNGPGVNKYEKKYSSGDYVYKDEYQQMLDLNMKFNYAYYDASSVFDDETAMRLCIKPREALPFHAGYLCGCFAESADVNEKVYEAMVSQEARNALNERFSGVTAIMGQMDIETQLVLMPVWLLASRQNDRVLYTAINGDSGEIVCDTTVSGGRFIALAVLYTMIILLALLALSSQVILRARLVAGFSAMLSAIGFQMLLPDILDTENKMASDTDPTRQMVKGRRSTVWLPQWKNKPNLTKWILPLAYVAMTVIFAFIVGLKVRNRNEFVGAFTSDVSTYPLFLTLISAGAVLWFINKIGRRSFRLLCSLLCVVQTVTLVYILGIPGRAPLYYLSLAMLLLLTVLILMHFRMHNGYVTRPVPFFGQREKST